MIKELTGSVGASGHEEHLASKLKDKFFDCGLDVSIDKFYNVIAKKKGNGKLGKSIMITAHYDEIALMLKSIDDTGFISFDHKMRYLVQLLILEFLIPLLFLFSVQQEDSVLKILLFVQVYNFLHK